MELDELEKSKFSFITFRAHVSEPQVFEDFISYFLPHISMKFPFYIYSIEKDDTPDRHIHVLLQHLETEKQKLKQKIEAKWYKDFNKMIKDKHTDLKCAIKYGKGPDGEDFGFTMKIEDKLKCIGYIFKDITRRNKTSGLSQSLITQSCDFYFANRRIKNAIDNDWIILTSKNIHVKIEQFCKENNYDVNSLTLQHDMVDVGHTFINLSNKQRKMAIAEVRRRRTKNYSQKNNAELEGEEFTQSDFYTNEEMWQKYETLKIENKRLREENEKLKQFMKLEEK